MPYRPALTENTHRLFFSAHRRRVVRVVNDAAIFSGTSWGLPTTLESIECRASRPRLEPGRRPVLFGSRQPRLKRPFSVRGRKRIDDTPAWVALSDTGDFVALSYWLEYERGSVGSYEVRCWPDLELVAEIPERSVFLPRNADASSSTNPGHSVLLNGGPLQVSPCGKFIATGFNNLLAGSQGIHLIEVAAAQDLPGVRFDEASSLLRESMSGKGRIGAFLFSEDSARVGANFIPHNSLVKNHWYPHGPPNLAAFDAHVDAADLPVMGWSTRTGESTDVEDLRERLFEAVREAIRCPNAHNRSSSRIVEWMGTGRAPAVVHRLWKRWMLMRLVRLNRRLEKQIKRNAD